ATLAAMTIAALWHGPSWAFVAWGVCHGSALVIRQLWKRSNLSMPGGLAWVLTFMFLTATIVFLRASTLGAAGHMLSRLLPHANPLGVGALKRLIPFSPMLVLRPIAIGPIIALFLPNSQDLATRFRMTWATAAGAAALVLISIFFINSVPARTFIYFGF